MWRPSQPSQVRSPTGSLVSTGILSLLRGHLSPHFQAVTRVAGRRWRWVLEVTAWDPPRRFAYAVVEGSLPMEVAYRCEAHGGGCRFSMVASANMLDGAFGRIVVPMIAWGMRREVRAHHGNLKRVLER